jgi:hypothetical protein
MAHVIHETAKRLAEAGFPKPTPEVGQYWHCCDSLSCARLIVPSSVSDDDQSFDIKKHFYLDVQQNRRGIDFFAPSATDILKELRGLNWSLGFDKQKFCCFENKQFGAWFWHENPAEAAALAWFHENENK